MSDRVDARLSTFGGRLEFALLLRGISRQELADALTDEAAGRTMSVQAIGDFTGVSSGCSFAGRFAEDSSGKNFYRVTVDFGPAPCALPNGTATGVAAVASDTVLAVGLVSGASGQASLLTRNP